MEQIEKSFNKFKTDIYRYAYALSGNRDVADDVVGEVFARVIQKGLNQVSKPLLVGYAKNIIKEQRRDFSSTTSIENFEVEDNDDSLTKVVLRDVVKREFMKLDKESREVILLRNILEFSFKEMAEVLTLDLSAVKLRYYRAIEKLKVAVGEKKKSKILYFIIPFMLKGLFLPEGAKASGLILGVSISAVSLVSIVFFVAGILPGLSNDNLTIPISYSTSYPNSAPKVSSTENIKIQNWDGSSLELKYPSEWSVTKYNAGSTYAFVSPSGAAFGYDFAQYQLGMKECGNNQAVEINGDYGKFKRYYDTSVSGVNWYICSLHEVLGKYFVDYTHLFTAYANNDVDLKNIDSIIASLKYNPPVSKKYVGKVFNVSFDYPEILGEAQTSTSKIDWNHPDPAWDCIVEKTTFSNWAIETSVSTGHCEGGYIGAQNEYTVYSKDGNGFIFRLDQAGAGNYAVGVFQIVGQEELKRYATVLYGVQIQFSSMDLAERNKAIIYIEDIVKTMESPLFPIKSNQFDQVIKE